MNKFFTTLMGCAFVCVASMAMVAQPTIYGSMTDNSAWGYWDRPEGIYCFSASEDPEITPVFTDGWDLAANGGGVLVDNVYHLFNDRGGSSTFSVNYTAFNIEDWSTEYSCYFSSIIVSNDMTCDPLTDKVYCAQPASSGIGRLAIWDPANIDNITTVGTLSTEILAIAANAQGELYGVGDDGGLYVIDKTDASMTLIGYTDVEPQGYQSAVFDLGTGVLYWAAYTKDGESSLYTVDTQSGEATLIKDFADNARFAGLYMLTTNTADHAPSAVNDLRADFASGSNSGTVSFTMPQSSFSGGALSGELSYSLTIDGGAAAGQTDTLTGKAAAGEKVELAMTLETGEHQMVLVVSNSAGESPKAKLRLYVGKGVPGYVNSAKASATEIPARFIVSWEAPDYCMPYEAYFDPTELRYDVVRQPGNMVIANHIAECSVTDDIDYDGGGLMVFKYEITPYVDDIAGYPSTTNGVVVGQPLEPPYQATMSNVDLDFFTIIDANHDGSSWYKDWYGYGVCCGGRWEGDCDDWLILPPMRLDDKGIYHLSVTVGHDYDGPSRWELRIGKSPTAQAMTRTLMEATSTVNSFEGDIKVSQDAAYYIGIHCVGAAGTTMYLSDITLQSSANYNAPDAPINVSGVGAEKGELAAYVRFTTPQTSISGDRLDSLTAANIYHGQKLVYTLEEVEPDTEYTVKVEADQEFNEYSVAAVNEYGEGRRTRIEYVFAGYDFPSQVTNFSFTEGEDGRPVLTWDPASETGQYGYYVNPEEVTYTIYRGYGNDTYDIIAEDIQGTSFVDSQLSSDTDQFMLTYYIYPWNSIGMGYGTASNTQCFGRPHTTPFVESFADGKSDNSPWSYRTLSPQTSGWVIYKNTDTTVEDIDGTNGLMVFFGESKGDEATLCAPYVTVKGIENPVLEFNYFSGRSIVTPTVTVNDQEVANTNTATVDGTDWCRFVAPLESYTTTDRIQIQFNASARQPQSYAFIDNIRVRRLFDHDMALSRLVVPQTMQLGTKTFVTVVVTNDGTHQAKEAKVTLYRNGYAVDEAIVENLLPAASATLKFTQIPDATFGEQPQFKAVVTYDIDQDQTNNSSAEANSSMKISRYPAPEDLQAQVLDDNDQNGCVSLWWSAPTVTSMAPEATTDDFESYEAFTTDLQPWTTVDGDKCNTIIMADPFSWFEDLAYPEAGEPMAYQVFNPKMVGIDTEDFWRYAPYSGDQALICWSTADYDVANDDWLISPELFEGGQTISFYVYSRTGYFDFEKYQVLYSSTDNETSSFQLLLSDAATDDWTKVSVELPSDAKYFAIHTVSYQSNTEIWFDDITYIPASSAAIPLELMGYNVYRDNVKINSELVTEPSYNDNSAREGHHKYNVTAVYGVGESYLSEDAYADVTTSLNSLTLGTVKVAGGKGQIIISGATGHNMKIISTSGMALKQQQVKADNLTVAMAQGIYVVTIDNKPFKVIVK